MQTEDTYDQVADEYYDIQRHPTCANFFDLSASILLPRITKLALENKRVLEVGCGRSISAELLVKCGGRFDQLTLLDLSSRMLDYSRNWAVLGARLIVSDARATGLESNSFDLIVSSLGDPYNGAALWKEVSRLLRRGGLCFFTTPAIEWAGRFREKNKLGYAEFLRTDGKIKYVRSEIFSVEDQREVIEKADLVVDEVSDANSDVLDGNISPKLLDEAGSPYPVLVRGYSVRKL